MNPQQDGYSMEQDGNLMVIRLSEISGFASTELREKIRQELENPERADVKFVIADCAELVYANSLFLEAIVGINNFVAQREGKVALACVADLIREVLRISHLDQMIPVYESVQEAKDQLPGS